MNRPEVTEKLVESVFDAFASEDLSSILIVMPENVSGDLFVGQMASMLRDYAEGARRSRKVAVFAAIVPREPNFAQRDLEEGAAESSRFDGVLSLANAWTPSSKISGRPGDVSRLAASVEGWLAACRSGALMSLTSGGSGMAPSRIMSAIRVSAVRSPEALEDVLRSVANPLWPVLNRTEVLVGLVRPNPGKVEPLRPYRPKAQRGNLRDRYGAVFATEDFVAHSRNGSSAFALALHSPEGGSEESAFEEYVAEVLRDLGWTIERGEHEAVDFVARRTGLPPVRIEVKRSEAGLESYSKRPRASGVDVVVFFQAPLGGGCVSQELFVSTSWLGSSGSLPT